MDEGHAWYLSVSILTACLAVVMLDAVLTDFDVPAGFFTVMAALAGGLGLHSIMRRNGRHE